MADVAVHSQPEPVPKPNTSVPPARNAPITPLAVKSLQRKELLAVDTASPVMQNGSFEFDRIIKAGEVLKRTRKTKSWKSVHLVLRPNLLSIYKDKDESKLRHQINLSEITAVARQKDPRRKEKHVFGLFSPSRNFHLEASSDTEAHEWVELIRREARFDEVEEEMSLISPGGAHATYHGFERSPSGRIAPSTASTAAVAADERVMTGYSSSDAEGCIVPPTSQPRPLPRQRERGSSTTKASFSARRPSAIDYSGPEHGSFSDFSDGGGAGVLAAARMSALSLAATEGRPSTSSGYPGPPPSGGVGSTYPAVASAAAMSSSPQQQQQQGVAMSRPSIGARSASQLSVLGAGAGGDAAAKKSTSVARDDERVVCHGWIYLLKSKSGVRQWKKVWMVLRPKALALYKNEEEYTAMLVLPFSNIIDVVEIDPISRSKTACLQIISEERNYRMCAFDEESLTRWLGGFKSLLSKRKAKAAGA